jgi:hypothetical protein
MQGDAHEAAETISRGHCQSECPGLPQLIICYLLLLSFDSDISYMGSIRREDAQTVQVLLHIGSNHCDVPVGIEPVQLVLLGVEVNDGLGLLIEDLQSLGNGCLVVVSTATGLATFEQPPLEFFLSALEVDD